VVGKPGGLTTSEALAKGLGFVVVSPIPGQEERNSDHLLEEGAAIRCNNLPVLAYKIDRLLDDPQRLANLRANALRMGRPRAAFDIVEKLTSLGKPAPPSTPGGKIKKDRGFPIPKLRPPRRKGSDGPRGG
jgi:processive 1,2-diacylglycerol beta-glucosyltransferase